MYTATGPPLGFKDVYGSIKPAYHLHVEDLKTRINATECGSVVNKEDVISYLLTLVTHPNLHTKQSSIQSDIYQMSY